MTAENIAELKGFATAIKDGAPAIDIFPNLESDDDEKIIAEPDKKQKQKTHTKQPKEEKQDNKIDYDLFIQIAMKDDPENFEKALSINGITTSDVKNMKDIQKEGVYGTYKKLISG